MPTSFKHAVNNGIGLTPVDVLTIPSGIRTTVIGCNIANITEADTVKVNVYVVDEFSTAVYYVKDISIPPNTALKAITQGEKLVLPQFSSLRIVSDVEHSLDTVVSYVEIS